MWSGNWPGLKLTGVLHRLFSWEDTHNIEGWGFVWLFGLFVSTLVLISLIPWSCVLTPQTHKARGAIRQVVIFGTMADLCYPEVLVEHQPNWKVSWCNFGSKALISEEGMILLLVLLLPPTSSSAVLSSTGKNYKTGISFTCIKIHIVLKIYIV